MTDHAEHLDLDPLKRFPASPDRVNRKMSEPRTRAADPEGSQASIIQHLGHIAVADATQQLAIDHVYDGLERRLEFAS